MRHETLRPLLCACFLGALLAGCSGEPSGKELDKALRMHFDKVSQQVADLSANMSEGGKRIVQNLTPELHSVKKLQCTPSPAEGYDCTVEVDSTVPMAGRTTQKLSLHFVKGPNGWETAR